MALGKMSGCVLIAIWLFATGDAFNYDRVEEMTIDESSENELQGEQPNYRQVVFEQLQQRFDTKSNDNDDCSCTGFTCQCCQNINIKEIHFHQKVCVSLTFTPETGTVTVEVTANGKVIVKEEFSVLKPPSFCFPIPATSGEFCIDFHDFHLDSETLSACIKISVSLFGRHIFSAELGCFHIHYRNSAPTRQFVEARIVEAAESIYPKKFSPIGSDEATAEEYEI